MNVHFTPLFFLYEYLLFFKGAGPIRQNFRCFKSKSLVSSVLVNLTESLFFRTVIFTYRLIDHLLTRHQSHVDIAQQLHAIFLQFSERLKVLYGDAFHVLCSSAPDVTVFVDGRGERIVGPVHLTIEVGESSCRTER